MNNLAKEGNEIIQLKKLIKEDFETYKNIQTIRRRMYDSEDFKSVVWEYQAILEVNIKDMLETLKNYGGKS